MPTNRFDALASAYDDHAAVAQEAGHRLLERLDGLRFEPARILDLGCATGLQCRALRERFKAAHIIGIDRSAGMLAEARRRRGRWRPRFDLLQADLAALPVGDSSVDLVYANLSAGWVHDLRPALASLRRALRPGGLVLVTMFGPDTLRETPLGSALTLGQRPDVQQLAALLVDAGFSEPVLDTDWLKTTHSSSDTLRAELLGVGLLPAEQKTGDSAKAPIAVSWEIVSASAWAPAAGQPVRGEFGEEASIPVDRIGIRQRS